MVRAGGGASQDPSGLQARECPDCALAVARLDVTRAHSWISASRFTGQPDVGKQTGVPRTPLCDPNTKLELRSGHPCPRDPAEGVGRMWWGEFSGWPWARGHGAGSEGCLRDASTTFHPSSLPQHPISTRKVPQAWHRAGFQKTLLLQKCSPFYTGTMAASPNTPADP